MSDDTPWQPPSSDDSADRPAERPDVSPWSREGADSAPVLPEPTSPVSPPPPGPTGADAIAHDAPRPDAPVAVAGAVTTSEPGKRRPVLVALAACAVVAVGLAAIFAVRQFNGESAGGADSPEALADEMMAAMEGEDVLGLVDLMLPGERESLGEPMIDTVAELQRLEILSSDLDLGALDGLDIVIEQHTTEVEQLGVDDIVMLHMSADASVTVDGDAIPVGALITDRLSEDELDEMRNSSATETDTLEMSMAAVEHDGSWYLSLLYTAAEAARTEAEVGDVPAEGIGAVGADSPEGVVDLFAEHLAALDIRGMLQLLDPAEAEALQRYAPLFLDEVEQAIADEAGDVEIRVTYTDVRVEGEGSARTLFIDGFTVDATIEGTSITAEITGDCIRLDYADEFGGAESFEQCATSGDTAMMEDMAGIEVPESVDAFVTAFTEAFSDMESVGLEVREREGQWYMSPIATGSAAMLAVLRALDRDELDELIDLGTTAADDFFDLAFGLVPGVVTTEEWADDEWADDEWSDDEWADDEWADEEWADDGDWSEYEESAVDVCYSIDDAAEATTCFETEIAAGNAEDWEMPVSLSAPECGLTDLLWSGDVYGLSDEEFTAAMTEAAPCFDALVADGYDEWLVPYEVDNVDCFEGRNPYGVFDEEYSDRVFDCAFAFDDDA